MNADIMDWQRRFFAQPMVFEVFEVWVGDESTGNFYATREGAEIEVKWRRDRKECARAIGYNLHSDELSRERWLGGDTEGRTKERP